MSTGDAITIHRGCTWRRDRARALAESVWLRAYYREYSRVPACPPGLLEFEPLERYIAVTAPVEADEEVRRCTRGRDRWATDRYIAMRTGFARGTVFRWRHTGGLNPWVGDLAALNLGEHPLLIWPDFHLVVEYWNAREAATGRPVAADTSDLLVLEVAS